MRLESLADPFPKNPKVPLQLTPELQSHQPVRSPGVHFDEQFELRTSQPLIPILHEPPGPAIPLEIAREKAGDESPAGQLPVLAKEPALPDQQWMAQIQVYDHAIRLSLDVSQPHRDSKQLRPLRVISQHLVDH